MTETEKITFQFGPYQTPRFRLGDVVIDEARDREVIIVGISDARIPWPIGKPKGERGRSLVVYGDLLRAIQQEANMTVCHWWDVVPSTVSNWRRLLDVDMTNPGTKRLRRERALEDDFVAILEKAHAKDNDPERNAKISASKKGIARPRHVIEAMKKARMAKPVSEETRQKQREAAQKRIADLVPFPLWTAEEDEIVRRYPAKEAAKLIGRSLVSVYCRRSLLKVPDARTKKMRALLG